MTCCDYADRWRYDGLRVAVAKRIDLSLLPPVDGAGKYVMNDRNAVPT